MHRMICLLVMFATAAVLPAGASALESSVASVNVQYKTGFQLAEESTDALLRNESAQRLRRALEHELGLIAPGCLGNGQLFELSIAEVKAAGAVGSTRGAPRSDVRVVRNSWVVWLRFDYRLLDGDEVIDGGSADLQTSGFVGDNPTERNAAEGYAKERALLSEWFSSRYCRENKLTTR
jgi:hypothetical protein